MIPPVNAEVPVRESPCFLEIRGCITGAGQIRAAQGSRMWAVPLTSSAAVPSQILLLPSSSRGAPICPRHWRAQRDSGKSPQQTQSVPQEGTVLGAAHMYFHNPDFFCSVCSHISINKQALTLPVDALNALLHSKHGNELVTWKVLSLTWAVHVQRGKKNPVSQIQ